MQRTIGLRATINIAVERSGCEWTFTRCVIAGKNSRGEKVIPFGFLHSLYLEIKDLEIILRLFENLPPYSFLVELNSG